MTELNRYDAGCLYAGEDEMVLREDGQYVKYSDFAALQQKLDAIAVENAALKENVELHANGFSVCPVCDHESPCDTDDIVWMTRDMKTPATDTYLNSVRAEGVELPEMASQVENDRGDDEAFWDVDYD